MFLSIGIVLPILFHAFKVKGDIWLPIYTGAMLASFYLPLYMVLPLAISIPILNNLLTNMPAFKPFPAMQYLILELIVLSVAVFIFHNAFGRKAISVFITALIAILLARLSSIILVPFFDKLTIQWWINHLVVGIPGIIFNYVVTVLMKGVIDRK